MIRRPLSWPLTFLAWLLGVVAAGALAGVVTFPLAGWIGGSTRAPGDLAVTGARTLGFFGLVWAPGIALVMAVKRAYETRRSKARPLPGERA